MPRYYPPTPYPTLYKNDVATFITFFMNATDAPKTPVTGIVPTVRLLKEGNTVFDEPVGPVTEIGAGWYRLACDVADLDTDGELIFHATGTGCDNYDQKYTVLPVDDFPDYDTDANQGIGKTYYSQG